MMTQSTKILNKHPQVSIKEGMKRYGNETVDAMLEEFVQLENQNIFEPQEVDKLTRYQHREALNLITLIKQKTKRKSERESLR